MARRLRLLSFFVLFYICLHESSLPWSLLGSSFYARGAPYEKQRGPKSLDRERCRRPNQRAQTREERRESPENCLALKTQETGATARAPASSHRRLPSLELKTTDPISPGAPDFFPTTLLRPANALHKDARS
ncbi:hypothetical protein MTO96_016624 [Rhipicephalus appendiculatus]